jgi:Zn-dependent M16 (insulinase) family peptidase
MIKNFLFIVSSLLLFACGNNPKFEGYRLIEKRFVKEVNADCYHLEHEKSGARIFKIAADDQNNAFCIGFKTLPEDNTGVAHILEHSVLNGSKNFPVKSPFDIMVAGSLKTFLNASTYKDRTLYPASSLNLKDYYNLMHVYFDAVFYPLIYDDPMIIMQEGWHHDIQDAQDDVIYKGVVYNEMNGAFSSPERNLYYQVNKHLFPDNTYQFSSGGLPEAIPDLTHDKFIAFHEKYYHPSNAYIYFYGNADLGTELAFIDSAYLSNFERKEIDAEIPLHVPFNEPIEVVESYSVAEGADTQDQTYVTMSFVIGDGADNATGMALDLLSDILVNQESAPIRLALQEAGLGSDVSSWTWAMRQHYFDITVTNANTIEKDSIQFIIRNTLAKVVKEGLDKEVIEGAINRMEFKLREGDDANKGVNYAYSNISTWMYIGDPFISFEYEKQLKVVKRALSTDYLEQIIENDLLNNPHSVLLALEPKPGLENQKRAQLKDELKKFKNELSKEELADLVQINKDLVEMQEQEDTPEALATVPMLSLSDINPDANWFEMQEKDFDSGKILHLNEFSNSILYAHHLFDLRATEQEKLPFVAVLSELLGKMNTSTYTFTELEKELQINTGGFSTTLVSYEDSKNNYQLQPKLRINTKATISKAEKQFELVKEIILNTDFSDTSRLKTILTKQHSRIEAGMKNNGYGIVRRRLKSYYSQDGMFDEIAKGMEYYWFLSDLLENYTSNADGLITTLQDLSSVLFSKENMVIAIACSEKNYRNIQPVLSTFVGDIPDEAVALHDWEFKLEPKNEGFKSASKVQYVAQGDNYFTLGYKLKGQLMVLSNIISRDWLHKEVRVKGGAYGGSGYFYSNGTLTFSSYRDPNLTSTLEAYRRTADYIATYEADSAQMTRNIIGTVSWFEYPYTVSDMARVALSRYYTGQTQEEFQQFRTEMLSTSLEDIRSLAPVIEKSLGRNNICVYGNQQVIDENEELFKVVHEILK